MRVRVYNISVCLGTHFAGLSTRRLICLLSISYTMGNERALPLSSYAGRIDHLPNERDRKVVLLTSLLKDEGFFFQTPLCWIFQIFTGFIFASLSPALSLALPRTLLSISPTLFQLPLSVNFCTDHCFTGILYV